MAIELESCPFCGGEAKLTDVYERNDACRSWIAVIEHGCTPNTNKCKGARVIYKVGGRDAAEAINNAIENWNRRANAKPIDESRVLSGDEYEKMIKENNNAKPCQKQPKILWR